MSTINDLGGGGGRGKIKNEFIIPSGLPFENHFSLERGLQIFFFSISSWPIPRSLMVVLYDICNISSWIIKWLVSFHVAIVFQCYTFILISLFHASSLWPLTAMQPFLDKFSTINHWYQPPRWRSRQRVSLIISRSWVRSSLGAERLLLLINVLAIAGQRVSNKGQEIVPATFHQPRWHNRLARRTYRQ